MGTEAMRRARVGEREQDEGARDEGWGGLYRTGGGLWARTVFAQCPSTKEDGIRRGRHVKPEHALRCRGKSSARARRTSESGVAPARVGDFGRRRRRRETAGTRGDKRSRTLISRRRTKRKDGASTYRDTLWRLRRWLGSCPHEKPHPSPGGNDASREPSSAFSGGETAPTLALHTAHHRQRAQTGSRRCRVPTSVRNTSPSKTTHPALPMLAVYGRHSVRSPAPPSPEPNYPIASAARVYK